jgi:hypothetical protein
VGEGSRNDTLARITGHLLGHGIDPHVCLDLIISHNSIHCVPPLPDAEVLTLVANIANREIAKRTRTFKESKRDR